MASLRDQGIDPAYHASAQWFGDAPSSEDFLIHLSKRIVTLMNEVCLNKLQYRCTNSLTPSQRDRTHPFWDILSPEIRHELHDTIATGPVDFLYGYQAVAEKNPNFRADVFNASATVDDKHGRGAVILNVHLSGYTCQAQKDGVILSNWRRSQEKWRCVSCFMVFGCPVPV